MKDKTLRIALTDGEVRRWATEEYDEYDIKGRFFIIIKGNQWVGMYALDRIVAVEVR